MKKYNANLSRFIVLTIILSLLTCGNQYVRAEIAPGITLPSFTSLQSNAKLPDPFKLLNGTRMTTKGQWSTRRDEISALAQGFIYGIKPPKPQTVTGSFSSNKINTTCTQNGKTISFSCSIQYPSTGKAPYPAMIGIGMNTLNTAEILKLGVALITFPCDELGQQTNSGSRGKGKFFDLYGSSYDSGALMAWAWGVSRLIDALETTPSANIDTKRLSVTGGSRYGKGALTVGAFDERIVLTIPQESGSGGTASWRVSDYQKSQGRNVQTLSQIIGENCWFSKAFSQFSGQTNKLPVDQHEVLALCAPRGLLVIENTSQEWLGDLSCYTSAQAARLVYEGLGITDRMGFSQIGGHGHCQFPASQQPELTAFIQKFLLNNNSANTNVNKTDGNFTFDKARWVDWTVPVLIDSSTTPTPTPTPTPTNPSFTSTPTKPMNPEDVNNDGVINMADAILIASCFNRTSEEVGFKANCDLDKNLVINMSDLLLVAVKFGKTLN